MKSVAPFSAKGTETVSSTPTTISRSETTPITSVILEAKNGKGGDPPPPPNTPQLTPSSFNTTTTSTTTSSSSHHEEEDDDDKQGSSYYDWTRIYGGLQTGSDDDDDDSDESEDDGDTREGRRRARNKGVSLSSSSSSPLLPPPPFPPGGGGDGIGGCSHDHSAEQRIFDLSQKAKMKSCLYFKSIGNAFFGEGQWKRAKEKYQRALVYCEYAFPETEKDVQEMDTQVRFPCLLNIVACEIRMGLWPDACAHSSQLLSLLREQEALLVVLLAKSHDDDEKKEGEGEGEIRGDVTFTSSSSSPSPPASITSSNKVMYEAQLLELQKRRVKALYRRAIAYRQLAEYQDAVDDLGIATQILCSPSSSSSTSTSSPFTTSTTTIDDQQALLAAIRREQQVLKQHIIAYKADRVKMAQAMMGTGTTITTSSSVVAAVASSASSSSNKLSTSSSSSTCIVQSHTVSSEDNNSYILDIDSFNNSAWGSSETTGATITDSLLKL